MDGSAETAAPQRRPEQAWPRAAGLFLIALIVSIARPTVLIGVAYVAMTLVLPVRRWPAYTLGVITVVLVLSGERDGLWWAERGWALLVAGWYLALTLRWPAARFFPRALAAVSGAVVVAAAVAAGSGGWEVLDWQVGERLRAGLALVLQTMAAFQEGRPVSPALAAGFYGALEAQLQIFPALAALGSLAALGTAWWMYGQLALGRDEALRPLREFRFNDHLVWVLIGGLALVLMEAGEGARRLGANLVVFMGALYALRGVAVMRFFGGARSVLGPVLLLVALLLAPPVALAAALAIGVGDTWLDLRTRARSLTA